MIGIYKITSPTNKIYIGQSRNLENRFLDYKYFHFKTQRKLYNSILKYGIDFHKFEIIHELPFDTEQKVLDNYERIYYDFYIEAGFKILNILIPGKLGTQNYKLRKKRKSSYKVTQYETNGKFIKVWKSVKSASEGLNIPIGGIRDCLCGKTKTARGFLFKKKGYRRDIKPLLKKERLKGYKYKERRNIPVYQYDMNGNFIKEWRNSYVAGEYLKIDPSSITSVCRGKYKQTGGFKWSKNEIL